MRLGSRIDARDHDRPPSPLKIAMVSEHADPLADVDGSDLGGRGVHVAELSAALARRGHEVTVYTRRDCPHGERVRFADAGYRVVRVDAGPAARIPNDQIYNYLDELTDGLAAAFAADQPHVAHAHSWMSAIATELAALPARVPVVVTFHGLGSAERRRPGVTDPIPAQRIPLETVIARRADAIAATCTDEVRELQESGVSAGRITVIPWASTNRLVRSSMPRTHSRPCRLARSGIGSRPSVH